MIEHSMMIALCVRNVENYLPDVIENINNIRSFVSKTKVVFVESDSTDRTPELLKEINDPDFVIISEGNLEKTYSERTARLSHCRNLYLDDRKI